ncbi:S24 family peptidase [Brevundimonas sp.]|uniref:S24 family peptidase n=1 Tax=Brevundimonas sp. TaxID=1871086 RepID=UPI003AF543FE
MPLTHVQIWRGLDRLALAEGLTASGLARRAGLDPTAFNPSKRLGPPPEARPRWPSTESLTRVLTVCGLSLGQFARLAEDAEEPPTAVPLLGLAQAGQDGFFDEAGLPTGEGWLETDLPRPRDGLYSLEVSGESMAPLYRPGDRLIVDAEPQPVRRGDRVVVRTHSGETLVKQVERVEAGGLTLLSINPDFALRMIPAADLAWVRRILWVSQ